MYRGGAFSFEEERFWFSLHKHRTTHHHQVVVKYLQSLYKHNKNGILFFTKLTVKCVCVCVEEEDLERKKKTVSFQVFFHFKEF